MLHRKMRKLVSRQVEQHKTLKVSRRTIGQTAYRHAMRGISGMTLLYGPEFRDQNYVSTTKLIANQAETNTKKVARSRHDLEHERCVLPIEVAFVSFEFWTTVFWVGCFRPTQPIGLAHLCPELFGNGCWLYGADIKTTDPFKHRIWSRAQLKVSQADPENLPCRGLHEIQIH
mmetsp:Transcript_97443/g.231885  ORF Transcript_97443/g.231885 Transcript_97443/m.231885 type:complete len:173 (-) Transcript_97443:919-1437(-)